MKNNEVTVTAASSLYMYVYILNTHMRMKEEKENHTITPLHTDHPVTVYKQLVSTLCVFIDHVGTRPVFSAHAPRHHHGAHN